MLNKTTLNEQELLRQLSAGDVAALRVIIQVYFPLLCSYAEKFLPDTSLAKDIAQETFIKLWRHKDRFENISGLKSFLFTVTKHGCLNLQRGREREEERYGKIVAPDCADEIDDHYDEIARLDSLAQINQVVQQMPVKMQEIFLLCFQEGLSNEEIARKLNISEKTVRNQKYNSLMILRHRFRNSNRSLLLLLGLLIK